MFASPTIARRDRGAQLKALAIAAALTASAWPVVAQETARTVFLPVANEAAPKLHVSPPEPEALARGVAIVPYRLENFRVLPIFGPAAAAVSPRAGHLHVTVDDLPWHWADAGATDAVVVAGLPAGRHRVLLEIATPDHRVIEGRTVDFVVPASPAAAHANH